MSKTFDDLVARCQGEVILDVNAHRSSYMGHRVVAGNHHANPQLDQILRLQGGRNLYDLQFYPDSPIGSYVVFGNTLEEVVRQAHDILDAADAEVDKPC